MRHDAPKHLPSQNKEKGVGTERGGGGVSKKSLCLQKIRVQRLLCTSAAFADTVLCLPMLRFKI